MPFFQQNYDFHETVCSAFKKDDFVRFSMSFDATPATPNRERDNLLRLAQIQAKNVSQALLGYTGRSLTDHETGIQYLILHQNTHCSMLFDIHKKQVKSRFESSMTWAPTHVIKQDGSRITCHVGNMEDLETAALKIEGFKRYCKGSAPYFVDVKALPKFRPLPNSLSSVQDDANGPLRALLDVGMPTSPPSTRANYAETEKARSRLEPRGTLRANNVSDDKPGLKIDVTRGRHYWKRMFVELDRRDRRVVKLNVTRGHKHRVRSAASC